MVRGGFVSVLGEVELLVLVWSGTGTQQQTQAVVKTFNHSLIFRPEAFFFNPVDGKPPSLAAEPGALAL